MLLKSMVRRTFLVLAIGAVAAAAGPLRAAADDKARALAECPSGHPTADGATPAWLVFSYVHEQGDREAHGPADLEEPDPGHYRAIWTIHGRRKERHVIRCEYSNGAVETYPVPERARTCVFEYREQPERVVLPGAAMTCR